MVAIPMWYRRPMAQIFMIGFVCFCTVGMFSAINQLGAGGTEDISLSDTTNAVLYGVFCIGGFFGGSINNLLGPRMTLSIGTLGYMIYIGGLWCYQTQGTRWFLILSGAILGWTASMLWSAQGCIMMSYPEEKDKGRSISIFWGIFQLGTFIGSIMTFAINVNDGGLSAVKTTTYLAIMIVMAFGTCLSFTMLPPNQVVRADGSRVEVRAATTVREEISGFLAVFKNKHMLLLAPLAFESNFFYTYQGAFTFAELDPSSRALGSVLSACGSIIGAQILGWLLDFRTLGGRRRRGFIGLALVLGSAIVIYSCGIAYQSGYTRATVPAVKINYKDKAFGKPAALLFFYYINDAFCQTLIYWIMGCLTNNPFTLARYAGFYKAIQSGGSAIAFGVDAVATPFMNELGANFGMLLLALPLAGIVISQVKEHEDLIMEDESAASTDEKKDTYAENVTPEALA